MIIVDLLEELKTQRSKSKLPANPAAHLGAQPFSWVFRPRWPTGAAHQGGQQGESGGVYSGLASNVKASSTCQVGPWALRERVRAEGVRGKCSSGR